MKETKVYSKPDLITHGDIEKITEVIGSAPVADSLIINGVSIPNTDGSGDIIS